MSFNQTITPKSLNNNNQKHWSKSIQNLFKTLNLYIFCIQKLFKSKLCIIMKVQEMLSNSYIYTKTVPTVHNLYQIQIEKSLKLVKYVFLQMRKRYKLYKSYTIDKIYTNVNWIVCGCQCKFFVYTKTLKKQ